MKKIILTLIISLFTSIAYAEHMYGKDYQYYWRNIPAICGTPVEVNEYIIDHGFRVHSLSVGRRGADPQGDPVYMITRYVNDNKQEIVVINVPNVDETCMLFHGYDLTIIEKGLT